MTERNKCIENNEDRKDVDEEEKHIFEGKAVPNTIIDTYFKYFEKPN